MALSPAQVAQYQIDSGRSHQQQEHGLGNHLERDAPEVAGPMPGEFVGSILQQLLRGLGLGQAAIIAGRSGCGFHAGHSSCSQWEEPGAT